MERAAGVDTRGGQPPRLRRRPSGEPPPLPRERRWTRWVWVLAGVLVLGVALGLLIDATDVVQRADQAVLGWLAEARGSGLTNAAKLVVLVTSFAAVIGLRIATVLVLVLYRRFRHLAVFLPPWRSPTGWWPGCCSWSFLGPGCRSWWTRRRTRSPPGRSRPWPSRCLR